MKIIVFDTETTGLPKSRKAPPSKTSLWPYVCQVSWLVYDDSNGKFYTKDFIVKLRWCNYTRRMYKDSWYIK